MPLGALLLNATPVSIAALSEEHWTEVASIFAAGIATGHATFESEVPSWDDFNGARLSEHRFVALKGEQVLGWVAASSVSDRCVYAGVIEHSVYVDPEVQGRGIGGLLLRALIDSTEATGIWCIQSGIFPENGASLALHAGHGFRTVGTRERVGRMTHGPLAGHWRDVVFIERRSDVAGL
jgi:L-amino acid N-acyltransferase YncA